ncbi:MAG: DNA polymerase III subunit delta' [Candidatus Omnitrophica bacterium]|nr:DNA polymerase III subunit delta' [Candidatus Omnitrophota bacterium]
MSFNPHVTEGRKPRGGFTDIRGHDAAISFLKRSACSGRLANAYIFCGPGGIGKKLTALNFAKMVNCLEPNEGLGCDNCSSCKKIDSFNHPDVHLVAPDKKGASVKIDNIRAIIKDIGLKSYEAKTKFYIVDSADSLTEEAANALLKTLEEPSGDSTLILITENPRRLAPTIRSRCQFVKFLPLDAATVEEILAVSHNVDRVKARVLAKISCGRVSEALELNDEDYFNKREHIIKTLLSRTLSDLEFDKVSKVDMKAILNIMLTWYRDILAAKAGGQDFVNIDKRDLVLIEAGKTGFEKLDNLLKGIISTQGYLDQNANPKLAMTALGLML